MRPLPAGTVLLILTGDLEQAILQEEWTPEPTIGAPTWPMVTTDDINTVVRIRPSIVVGWVP